VRVKLVMDEQVCARPADSHVSKGGHHKSDACAVISTLVQARVSNEGARQSAGVFGESASE
jgi:hypothetical protein